jgi:Secretion system C-terminal sorting domain
MKACYSLIILFLMTLGFNEQVKGANETLDSNSYIINMGVTPQTFANGLKPYGLVYALIDSHIVSVKWVIKPGKLKDAADFTYNGTDYKGGTFIVPAEFIDSTVKASITYWEGEGVVGEYTTSPITVPVYRTLTAFSNIVLDTDKGDLAEDYFINAGIPSAAYSWKYPSTLDFDCDDIFILPHADPTWTDHGNLKSFLEDGGYVWAGCHAVSVLEGLYSGTDTLNFLTTNGLQCYKNDGSCGYVTEDHAKNASTPYNYDSNFDDDPVMQFMGTLDGTMENGSEQWFIPQTTGQWRSNVKRVVKTSDGSAPGKGIKAAYGYAYGDTSNGMVMYEGGHKYDKGSIADRVAAQRAMFNFILMASGDLDLNIVGVVPTQIGAQKDTTFVVSVTGGDGTYTYQWTSTWPGTFSNPNDSQTTFLPDTVYLATPCVITLEVTDGCGRENFYNWNVIIYPVVWVLPVVYEAITVTMISETESRLAWTTLSEINNKWFEIERKHESEQEFKYIGKVDARQSITGSISQNYQFLDDLSLEKGGNYVYRLKQVDIDGTFEYSKMVEVEYFNDNVSAEEFIIYPNPTNGSFSLQVSINEESDINIELFNLSGQLINRLNYPDVSVGMHTFRFDDFDLMPGSYMIRFVTKRIAKLEKLIVVN